MTCSVYNYSNIYFEFELNLTNTRSKLFTSAWRSTVEPVLVLELIPSARQGALVPNTTDVRTPGFDLIFEK